jgi:DNA-binding response OmpR family regulator
MTASDERNTTPTRKPTILIVEDDDQLRVLLCTILEQSGYSVRRAPDGIVALEELRSEVPDILLSDLYMPRMSGFELLSIVRRQFPLTRVIAMSSAFSASDVPPGITADAFYPKASDIAGLLKIIETMARSDASSLAKSPASARLAPCFFSCHSRKPIRPEP